MVRAGATLGSPGGGATRGGAPRENEREAMGPGGFGEGEGTMTHCWFYCRGPSARPAGVQRWQRQQTVVASFVLKLQLGQCG